MRAVGVTKGTIFHLETDHESSLLLAPLFSEQSETYAITAMKTFEEVRSSESPEASPMEVAIIPAPQPIETLIDRLVEEMLYLETSHQKLR